MEQTRRGLFALLSGAAALVGLRTREADAAQFPLSPTQRNPEELAAFGERILRLEFDKICKGANVSQFMGPSYAFFETGPDSAGFVKRFVYISFGMNGAREPGAPRGVDETLTKVMDASIKSFRTWLKPGRPLVWREIPVIDFDEPNEVIGSAHRTRIWASYWRCVQDDVDVGQPVTWEKYDGAGGHVSAEDLLTPMETLG